MLYCYFNHYCINIMKKWLVIINIRRLSMVSIVFFHTLHEYPIFEFRHNFVPVEPFRRSFRLSIKGKKFSEFLLVFFFSGIKEQLWLKLTQVKKMESGKHFYFSSRLSRSTSASISSSRLRSSSRRRSSSWLSLIASSRFGSR